MHTSSRSQVFYRITDRKTYRKIIKKIPLYHSCLFSGYFAKIFGIVTYQKNLENYCETPGIVSESRLRYVFNKKIDFLRSALGLKKESKKENSGKESFLFSSALTEI